MGKEALKQALRINEEQIFRWVRGRPKVLLPFKVVHHDSVDDHLEKLGRQVQTRCSGGQLPGPDNPPNLPHPQPSSSQPLSKGHQLPPLLEGKSQPDSQALSLLVGSLQPEDLSPRSRSYKASLYRESQRLCSYP